MSGTPGSSAVRAGQASSRRWLLAAFAATLAVTAWLAVVDDEAPPPGRSAGSGREPLRPAAAMPQSPPSVVSPASWPAAPLARRPGDSEVEDSAWAMAEPSAPSASAGAAVAATPLVGPVVPTAPAFGYSLIGRLDDGQAKALLTGPLNSFDVRAGDMIDGQWRVDAITAEGLTITWLPAGQRQHIGFKAS